MNEFADRITAMEHDDSLFAPQQLRRRVDALDFLEDCQSQGAAITGLDRLRDRITALTASLEAANYALFQSIRNEVRRGAGRECLLQWWTAHGPGPVTGEGYDYLDELAAGVLQFESAQLENTFTELPPEMVFYQPTPARHVFSLIERVAPGPHDVLVDLGSGLGHVPLLASICSTARCIGIEREASYVDCARRSAHSLNLAKATFIDQDARNADLSSGTVFYLYTPFSGTILRAVLDALRREADRREIRICAFGPCVPTIAQETWLYLSQMPCSDQIAIFRSRR